MVSALVSGSSGPGLMLGVTLQWTSIPSRGEWNWQSLPLHATESGDKRRPDGHRLYLPYNKRSKTEPCGTPFLIDKVSLYGGLQKHEA